MTRETKVGLLVGMGVILLIGIIVSDHLAVMHNERREVSDFADRAQRSIEDSLSERHLPEHDRHQSDTTRRDEPPATGQHQRPRWTPDLELTPRPRLEPDSRDDRIADQRRIMPQAYALDNLERSERLHNDSPADQPRHAMHYDEYQTLVQTAREADAAFGAIEPEQTQREPETIVHRVERNETLYDIAERYYGDGNYWRTIAEQNAERIFNGEHVREGVELTIPNRSGLAGQRAQQASQRGTAPADRAQPRTIQAERGDTLMGLAAEHLGSARRWRELLDANRDQLDSDRDLRAGMTLKLPTATAASPRRPAATGATSAPGRTYVIRRGDTLTRIAEQELGDPNRWRELFDANRGKLDNPDRLPVGEEIQIPS